MDFVNKTFEEEEDKLFLDFIDTYKLPGIKTTYTNWHGSGPIELILNPECNQQCEYCYIYKYGKKLYPLHTRGTKDQQLNNLKLLLNYLVEHKIFCGLWELFGGDLFHDKIIFEVFDQLYDYFILAKAECDEIFKSPVIIIPNNLSYLEDDAIFERVYNYQKKYQAAGLDIGFSWSTDGKFCTESREKKELTDAYWDAMFAKVKKLYAGVHPMVASENVKYWCENFIWWQDMLKKYDLKYYGYTLPSMLEVRNDGWTDESIQDYLKLIKLIYMDRLKMHDNNPQKLAAHFFVGDGRDGSIAPRPNMDLLCFPYIPAENHYTQERVMCSIQELLHIDMSTLEIVPCHRTAYPIFRGGKFVVENNKIIGLKAINPSLYLSIHTLNKQLLPVCVNCQWRNCCMKGCLGAQYEYSGELFNPIPSVCKLLKAKYAYLITLYNESGVLQAALDHNYLQSEFKNFLISQSRALGYKINEEA